MNNIQRRLAKRVSVFYFPFAAHTLAIRVLMLYNLIIEK